MRDFRSVPGCRRAIAVIAVSLAILFSLMWESEIRADARYDQVCPKTGSVASIQMPDGQPIAAEISCRPSELRHGLMYRSELPQNRGMLFVYRNPGLHQHWMRHCLIPLDIVWMDFHHRVREVMKSVPACNSILPSGCRLYGDVYDAVYVVELVAGTANRHGLKSGDQLPFSIPHQENQ
jgi:uncharacterized membrane protein (UPF0127 family)